MTRVGGARRSCQSFLYTLARGEELQIRIPDGTWSEVILLLSAY